MSGSLRAAALAALLLLLALPYPAVAATDCEKECPSNFEAYKENYFLVSRDRRVPDDDPARMPEEVIFQLSLKARIGSSEAWPLYLGYTQRSFWQLFDKEDSAPFRESNYNPEAFLDYRGVGTWVGDLNFRVGIEHESNGQSDPRSRSWNRTYLQVGQSWPALAWALKGWDRWNENPKNPPQDPKGDDNPDILSYLGSYELKGWWKPLDRLEASFLARRGKRELGHPVSGRVMVDWEFDTDNGFWLRFEYAAGYGDSLIDYNVDVRRTAVGIIVKPAGVEHRLD